MKRENGFTLIELLAIIVILAIIAVITVPIILGIIDDASENAAKDSAYGFKDSVNKYYAQQLLNNQSLKLNDTYTVTNGTLSGGNFGDSNITSLPIQVSGTVPTSGSLTYSNNKLTSGCLKIGDYAVTFSGENVTNTTKGECGEIELGVPEPEEPEFPESLIVTSGDGLYESETEPGRLIYRGANPNNYINIKEDGTNNTLYRIISFEVDGTIKVVRDESIIDEVWDNQIARHNTNNTFCNYSGTTGGCNVWGNQTNTLYNGESLGDNFHYFYYANADDTTLTNGDSGTVVSDSTLNQYLNSKITNSSNSWQPAIVLDNYIDNHQWNVGGVYYTTIDKGIEKEKEEERQLKWIGKIALLNITEYVEASTNSECTSVRKSNYSGRPCKETNWTFKNYSQWSLSPASNSHSGVWGVHSSGSFDRYTLISAMGVRPAFYLKSGISLTGEGTSANPYTISGM